MDDCCGVCSNLVGARTLGMILESTELRQKHLPTPRKNVPNDSQFSDCFVETL
jgi:hypothetical protein